MSSGVRRKGILVAQRADQLVVPVHVWNVLCKLQDLGVLLEDGVHVWSAVQEH